GNVEALEGTIIDMSDRKKMENELMYNNYHDRWTGLFDRCYLEHMLVMHATGQIEQKKAVISINLSPFHSLTTTYWIHYCREIKKKTVDALLVHCSEKRYLFHTYENRFVFYIKDYTDKNELMDFCERLKTTLEPLLALERVEGGIGILEIEGDEGND